MPRIVSEEETIFLTAPEGTVFYSEKPSNYLSAQARHFGRKIETKMCLIVEGTFANPVVSPITKVTVKGYESKDN